MGAERSVGAPEDPGECGTDSHNGKSESIVRNAFVGYVCLATGLLSGVVITPVVLRLLGPIDYGLWIFLSSLIGYLGLTELGIGGATSRRVAAATAANNAAELRRVVSSAFAVYLVIASVAAIAAVALALGLPFVGRIPAAQWGGARATVLVLGLGQVVNFLLLVRTATIVGVGRMDLTAAFGAVSALVGSGMQVGLLALGAGVPGMAAVTAATSIVTALYTARIVRKRFPLAKIDLREARWETARELLRFGGRNAVVAVCGTLAFNADAAMIGMMLPLTAVTQYAVASKLVGLLRTLALKPIDVLLPAYAHAQRLDERERMERLFTESIGIALAVAIPGAICLAAFGMDVFQLWLGGRHPASYPILVVLSAALIMQLPGHASFTILTGTDRTLFLMRATILSALCNVALSLTFTRLLGVIGPALGTLCTVVVVDMVILPWSVCREFGFKPNAVLTKGLLPVLTPALLAGSAAVGLVQLRASGTPLGVVACVGAVGGIFLLSWFLVGIPANRRARYSGIVRRMVPFLPRPAVGTAD